MILNCDSWFLKIVFSNSHLYRYTAGDAMTRLETTQSELEASNEAAAAAAAAAEGDVKAARAQASAAAAELEMVERAAEEAAVEVDAANARADGRRLSLPHTRPLTSYESPTPLFYLLG